MEFANSSQDGLAVVDIHWNKVIVAKVCTCLVSFQISISVYAEVVGSKCWSVPSVFIDSSLWVCHHALEGSKIFFIFQRKDECLGSGTIPPTTCINAIGF